MFSLVLGIARITQNRPTASTLPRNCGEPSGVIEAVRIGYGIERRLVGHALRSGLHRIRIAAARSAAGQSR